MKHRFMKAAPVVIVLLALAFVCLMSFKFKGDTPEEEMETLQLQILATSDLHGKFLAYDYALNEESTSGSCAQIASSVNELRTENTIVVDGGDIIQDNSAVLFLDDDMHPMMLAMNEIGYDVWITGNHEYNFGMDVLQRVIQQNNAPLLCGNVYNQDMNPLADAYVIIERGGVKVGIIGMVTPNIKRWDEQNLKDWIVTDPVEETRKIIDEIGDSVDVLIAVEHMHVDNECDVSDSGVEDLANACPELDLIVAAHGHQMIDDLTINGVPIIENKNMGATLGQILFDIEKTDEGWQVVNTSTKLIMMSDYESDEELTEKLQPYHERAVDNANTVIGSLENEYLAAPNEIAEIPTAQIEDTALMDLINEVQLYYTGADVSGAALSTTNANMFAGDIKRCDVSLIYKFSNTLYKAEFTGRQLKRWMEWSACYYNTYAEGDLTVSFNEDVNIYNYDMFSGVDYTVDISKEPGSRIEDLTFTDGTPVDDDDVIIVALNNYRWSSQLSTYGEVFTEEDGLPKLLEMDVRGDIGGIRELIADYIINVKDGTLRVECDNNWMLVGNDWDEELHAMAVEQLAEGKLAIPVSEDGKTSNVKSITADDLK